LNLIKNKEILKLDIIKLYQDYSVKTPDKGHKHYREGWINTACPFCSGDPGYHLGYNIQNSYMVCWRCGHVPLQKGIAGVLGISYKKAKEILKEYKGISYAPKPKIKAQKRAFRIPNGLMPLTNLSLCHTYLISRGFSKDDIIQLQEYFGLMQTGPTCVFIMNKNPVNLKFRIFAPIYYNDLMVSWQTRDITGNSALKYITCPKESEKMNHKKLIYMDRFINTKHLNDLPNYIVLCEGIFDVWKVHLSGYFAGCGFGVDLTMDQVYFLKKNFNKIYFFLDPDAAGNKKGKELFSQLCFAGVDCVMIKHNLNKDPGDMSKEEIKGIMDNLEKYRK
jgi:hypothetical protein